MDCHGAGGGWSFNSLIAEQLDRRVEFVVQHEWTEYTGALEDGCDAALFVGMHAMAGTPDGLMNHTVSGTDWRSVTFNGVEVGETGINAALCGTWGCPVVLVTGDQAACREGTALLGDGLETVQVKTALGRFSARHKTPAVARELIEAGARRAARQPRRRQAVRPRPPVRDPGRAGHVRPRRAVPPPARGGDRRGAHHRLPRGRLVDGLAAVLLLARLGGLTPPYRIETARLVVRCWQPTDAAALKEALDPSVEHLRPWLPWAHEEPKPLAEKAELLRSFRGHVRPRPGLHLRHPRARRVPRAGRHRPAHAADRRRPRDRLLDPPGRRGPRLHHRDGLGADPGRLRAGRAGPDRDPLPSRQPPQRRRAQAARLPPR